jgi:uroporphyrinogen-III synthase
VAPTLRDVPLTSNTDAVDFAAAMRGEVDIVIFLTGLGTRALVRVMEATYARDAVIAALARTQIVARGPKPLAVLRELVVPVWIVVPEPNTWREVLVALEAKPGERPLGGARVAVQEYGVANTELLEALHAHGALVTRVPVYRWALPEDVAPLKTAVTAIGRHEIDVVLFTTSVQVVHLWQIAREMGLEDRMEAGLVRSVVASIGPTTSDELRRHGRTADLEASHGKIGVLVREAAQRSAGLLRTKRSTGVST